VSLSVTRRAAGIATVLALTISLTACGGDDDEKTDSAAQSSAGQPQEQYAPPPSFPTPSAAPVGYQAIDGVPAITKNAQSFESEPTIAKGTGDAPQSLVIRDILVGNGEAARPGDSVEVRYVGALYKTGEVFDASWKNGKESIPFALSQVVPGFAGGIVGMKIGGRREIVIPAALGYGDRDIPGIPAGSTLVFVVDLTGVSRPDTGEVDEEIPGG
jgi:peptidylprolyl isomerase